MAQVLLNITSSKLSLKIFLFSNSLYISNDQPQKDKQQSATPIIFPYLTFLELNSSHEDYAEQFLFEINTRLPRLVHLGIKYESLVIITHNCIKLRHIDIYEPFVRSKDFHSYFPLL